MRKSIPKVIAAFSLAALTSLQFTVSAFADIPQEPDDDLPTVTEVTVPEVTEPEETETDAAEPEETEPDVTEPEVTESEETEPNVTEPEVTEPEAAEPEETEASDTEEDEEISSDYLAQAETIFALDADMVLPDVGVEGFYVSDEEMAGVRAVIDEDKKLSESDIYTETLDASYNYSTNYYYNQLNTVERNLYNNLANTCSSFLNSSKNLTSQYLDYIQYDSSISSTRLNQVVQLFYYSNPQYFFLTNGYRYGSNYMYPMIYSDYQSYSARSTAYSNLNYITSSWMTEINKLSTDIAKEEWIYKKLCSTVSYGSSSHNQSIIGALVEKQCVCNGYAMAMVYFCNAAGIDCITVVTENHAWNRVKLQGYWYEIDVTWMDQGTYINNMWCNKSTSYFQSLDQTYDSSRLSHTITTAVMNKYYTNITLPSCTRNDPAGSSSIGLKVTSAENGAVTLKWNSVSGATNYMVYTYINGVYNSVGSTTKTTYVVSGLVNNVKYGFLVRYYKNGAWSSYSSGDIVYATPKYSAKPSISSATPGNGSVYLKWSSVSGASKYSVYTYINGQFTCVGSTTGTSYTVSGLTNGIKYGFLVRAYVNGTWSSYTSSDIVYATPKYVAKPKITKVTPGNARVGVNWTSVSGASRYAVYTYLNGKWTLQGYRTTTGMNVKNLKNGVKYGFAVKAYVNGSWSDVMSSDIVYAAPVYAAKPKITKATSGYNQIALNWTSVSGASRYAVYTYLNGKWTLQGYRATTGMNVKNLVGGVKYGFAVKAYVGGVWSDVTSSDIVYATPSSVPSSPKITSATAGVSQVTIKWSAVSGASKYAVYTYVNGTYSLAATVTGTSCTVKNLAAGIKYGFLVRGYVNGSWTSYTSSNIVYCTPLAKSSTPQITNYSKGSGYVTLEWSSVSGASNYAVYTYINGDYSEVKQTISTSCTITGLANGINYGFVVRAYVNGSWTAVSSSDIVYITPGA